MPVFDAQRLVDAWADSGTWPGIHQPILTMIREVCPRRESLCDLGSSTGLLARHLHDLGYRVCAVEQPGSALTRGIQAGVYDPVPYLGVRIVPAALPVLAEWLQQNQVTTLVARRVFPELWDALGADTWPQLPALLLDAGVRRIVLEGRVPSGRTTHPLGIPARERAALTGWTTHDVRDNVSVMTPTLNHD